MKKEKLFIAVIGGNESSPEELNAAEEVGRESESKAVEL